MAFIAKILFLLCCREAAVVMARFSEAPVPEKLWSERCDRTKMALNDCNWCRCGPNQQYICSARICQRVDMFGHFNDAIQEVDVGMEGHGVWRSTESACEAGVHYRKGDLLCVCTEDGIWPNPVCRDVFQVLHIVEPTKFTKPDFQNCSPTKLYQAGCNVCICPPSGLLKPELCTKRNCSADVANPTSINLDKEKDETVDEVYAACERAKKYQIGCKTCVCLPNNRLLCDNCTSVFNYSTKVQLNVAINNNSLCSGRTPGEKFKKDCNICYCDQKDIIYCSVLNCIDSDSAVTLPKKKYELVTAPIEDSDCVPSTTYKRGCNKCHCFMADGVKWFGCTMKDCSVKKSQRNEDHNETGCVVGTQYEKNCLICQCVKRKGEKMELCTTNDRCKMDEIEVRSKGVMTLDALHGYCEPLHTYEQDCNKCKCLTDGKTVACTSRICSMKLSQEKPVMVEFIPFVQKEERCPKGHRYKINCNVCHCMSNGNALCTTRICKNKNQ